MMKTSAREASKYHMERGTILMRMHLRMRRLWDCRLVRRRISPRGELQLILRICLLPRDPTGNRETMHLAQSTADIDRVAHRVAAVAGGSVALNRLRFRSNTVQLVQLKTESPAMMELTLEG
jgi:hypothetical protein